MNQMTPCLGFYKLFEFSKNSDHATFLTPGNTVRSWLYPHKNLVCTQPLLNGFWPVESSNISHSSCIWGDLFIYKIALPENGEKTVKIIKQVLFWFSHWTSFLVINKMVAFFSNHLFSLFEQYLVKKAGEASHCVLM